MNVIFFFISSVRFLDHVETMHTSELDYRAEKNPIHRSALYGINVWPSNVVEIQTQENNEIDSTIKPSYGNEYLFVVSHTCKYVVNLYFSVD